MLLFVENPGEVLDREFLVENIRGITWQTYDRSVDVLVSRLRNKLGETPTNTRFIKQFMELVTNLYEEYLKIKLPFSGKKSLFQIRNS